MSQACEERPFFYPDRERLRHAADGNVALEAETSEKSVAVVFLLYCFRIIRIKSPPIRGSGKKNLTIATGNPFVKGAPKVLHG